MLGTIAYDMRDRDRSPWASLFGHIWEVELDMGPLRHVRVPYAGEIGAPEFVDLPTPNFHPAELEEV
jgi:hypothetical protein